MFSSEESESENILEKNYIDYGVKDISSLHLKSNISTLNLHYNQISIIKGLDHLINLRHLDLSSNCITKISGLDSLIYLRTLNLSANHIKKISGVSQLRQLVKLNVSYNEITDITGLQEFVNISNHPLTVIEIQGNQIKLISQVIRNCQQLVNLRQLILSDGNSSNPVCNIQGYRTKILSTLSNLRILDGKDRSGNPIEINILSDIPGLEQFIEYLSSSTDHYSENTLEDTIKYKPKANKNMYNTEKPKSFFKEQESSKEDEGSQSELKVRMQDLETKLASLVNFHEKGKIREKPEENLSIILDENSKLIKQNQIKEKSDGSDVKIGNLIKELDRECHKRQDVEKKLQLVINKYKDMQLMMINDKKSKSDALKSTEKLTNAFSKEKYCRQELEERVSELQTCLNERETELSDLKHKLESSNMAASRKLEEKENLIIIKSEQLMQNNQELNECKLGQKIAETNAASVKKHCTNLEDQVENLQTTLSRREKEYQTNLMSRYALDSNELKDYVEKQVSAAKTESMFEINVWKNKVTEANDNYHELENEFRLALHMEADRYKKLEHSYVQILSELNSLKAKQEILTKKDNESKSLILELTTVAKEQKSKLIELSKNKQETNKNTKERILTLEAHLEEARRQMIQFELTKQENKKIQAKLSAQESVIEGLRAERKLWSEELAQQGYLLTQDRAKLECKIDSQTSEINSLKLEIDKAAETLKVKSKIIEDQTSMIIKIKDGLAEKDQEAKSFTEKLLEDQKEMEKRTQALSRENAAFQDVIDKLTKRKEELKDVIVDLQDKLDESENTREKINQKWIDKSELIAKLENQVVQMKNHWEKKTSELIDERNEARDKSNSLQMELETIERNYKSQLEVAYKNRDFVRQEAEERIALIEDEMRRLLMETDEEKKKLNSRLKILNKAIQELDSNPKVY